MSTDAAASVAPTAEHLEGKGHTMPEDAQMAAYVAPIADGSDAPVVMLRLYAPYSASPPCATVGVLKYDQYAPVLTSNDGFVIRFVVADANCSAFPNRPGL